MESSSNAAAAPLELPVELVREILELIARGHLVDDAPFAASLQMLSRAIRDWLQPIVFHVFVVQLPSTRTDTPLPASFALFLRMLHEPDATPRRHVWHLVLHGNKLWDPEDDSEITASGEWRLDSIWAERQLFQLGVSAPRIILDTNGHQAGVAAVMMQTQHPSYLRRGWAWSEAGSLQMMRAVSPFPTAFTAYSSVATRLVRSRMTQPRLRPLTLPLTLIFPVCLRAGGGGGGFPCHNDGRLHSGGLRLPELGVILEIHVISGADFHLAGILIDRLIAFEQIDEPERRRVRFRFVTETMPTDALEYAAWLCQGNNPWFFETNSINSGSEQQ